MAKTRDVRDMIFLTLVVGFVEVLCFYFCIGFLFSILKLVVYETSLVVLNDGVELNKDGAWLSMSISLYWMLVNQTLHYVYKSLLSKTPKLIILYCAARERRGAQFGYAKVPVMRLCKILDKGQKYLVKNRFLMLPISIMRVMLCVYNVVIICHMNNYTEENSDSIFCLFAQAIICVEAYLLCDIYKRYAVAMIKIDDKHKPNGLLKKLRFLPDIDREIDEQPLKLVNLDDLIKNLTEKATLLKAINSASAVENDDNRSTSAACEKTPLLENEQSESAKPRPVRSATTSATSAAINVSPSQTAVSGGSSGAGCSAGGPPPLDEPHCPYGYYGQPALSFEQPPVYMAPVFVDLGNVAPSGFSTSPPSQFSTIGDQSQPHPQHGTAGYYIYSSPMTTYSPQYFIPAAGQGQGPNIDVMGVPPAYTPR